ncbi:TerD family protein [Paenibacillus athensensis]|uniref:Tellurium resistance protein TerA n=1 Tax=Paenibacillus athensensis TaxID=1967502 RepID=A0A4Y8PZ40_9BACL|nr:TerD family protein [Paenibacillus athensensis]MCD1261472.1 TerD family protein [Paenibacillus athensensis]
MAVTIVKGQKADLTKTSPGLQRLTVALNWNSPAQVELDTSAFLLAASGKVTGDEDLIFYGNPKNSFITYVEKQTSSAKKFFHIDLQQIPAAVDKIAFTLTIYEGEQRKQTFGQVTDTVIRFANEDSGQELLRYELGNNFSVETAIVVGELYRYNQDWKFNAVGAGYSGGLSALCGSFGIEVDGAPAGGSSSGAGQPPSGQPSPPAPPKSAAPPAPPAAPPSPPPAPSAPSINLTKIELKKKGDVINLTKPSGGMGEILINLNWNQQQAKSGGFFSRKTGGVDLDLACLYELKDGRKGVIQALGESFGALDRPPYVALDGDDRTGSVKTGENIRINGKKVSEIKRLLVFAFIYEGVANWSQADGVVTLKQPSGPDIVVQLDEHDNRHRMCAIAMIRNVGDETFSIERLVQYYAGHKEIDQAYGWGLRWVAGSK